MIQRKLKFLSNFLSNTVGLPAKNRNYVIPRFLFAIVLEFFYEISWLNEEDEPEV